MTVIEAICCHVPVIVPDVDGITELVEDNGIRVEPHAVEELAAAMVAIIRDRRLRDRAAVAARRMKKRFDGRNVARHFIAAYTDALRG
jgi:glycosyltransferase involved in cell wall biosynthesis